MTFYFAHSRSAKYCNQRVCLSVCLSVCRSHLSTTTSPNFTKFSVYMSTVGVARSSDDNVISYVLPVLSMTSRFHTIDHVVYGEVHGRRTSASGGQRRQMWNICGCDTLSDGFTELFMGRSQLS